VDGMSVYDLKGYLADNWSRIREDQLSGDYEPQPVLGIEIPQPGGKVIRQLGIPTALDRLIQQVLNQVMQPIFDPAFPGPVMASALGGAPTRRCFRPANTRPGGAALWWIWTWKSFVTE
jgi:RNA-directed DNA polymerase